MEPLRRSGSSGTVWLTVIAGLVVLVVVVWYLWASHFFETPPRPEDVIGSTWLVVALDGDTDLPRLTFNFAEGELTVWTGCRSVTEQWYFDSDGFLVGFGPIVASDPPCSGDAATIDRHILDSLSKVEGWHLTSTDAMTLRGSLEPTELHLVRELDR